MSYYHEAASVNANKTTTTNRPMSNKYTRELWLEHCAAWVNCNLERLEGAGWRREITPDDVTKEADRNYELGRKHGHSEKADLLDWAESLLCNAVPMSHCTQEDWDAAVKKWRDEKHGVAKSANDPSSATC
jgi:hypothetical protein